MRGLPAHPGREDPLDASGVHPESYPVVRKILDRSGITLAELIGNELVLRGLKPTEFADDTFGVPTVTDILGELEKPGRDPRPAFTTATFAAGVEKVADLTPGMILEGVVTNVAAFGAFVDIGVHQDGLVHVSAMSDRFVSDPHDVVRSGQGGAGEGARCGRRTAADRVVAATERRCRVRRQGWCEAAQSRCGAEPGPARPSAGRRWSGSRCRWRPGSRCRWRPGSRCRRRPGSRCRRPRGAVRELISVVRVAAG